MALSLALPGPSFQPLATARLLLRPLAPGDAVAVHRLVNDWSVVRMLSRLPFPYPRKLTDEWIASTARQLESGAAYHLAITGDDNGQEVVVGCIGLRLDMAPRAGNLGYWVGRRFWGHGVATEAAECVSRWALANLDIDRVQAHAAVDNPHSAAVLRRVGFREVGAGRERFLARGGEHPVLRFEATREDLFPPAPIPTPAPVPTLVTDDDAPRPATTGTKPLVLVAACALVDTDGRVLLAQPPGGQADGRAVGVPRRQAPTRRNA